MKTKYFKENGFLNENGGRLVNDFITALSGITYSQIVKDMSVEEVRLLRCNLSKVIGDSLSEVITAKLNEANK